MDPKKHKCEVCDKIILGSAYKFKCHLYKHRAVAARFECSVCPKKFFRRDAYNRHLNKHAGKAKKILKNYICDHCDRAFVNKQNLIRHLRVHDDSFRCDYKCVACGNTYCERRLLQYHIRKTHYNLQDKAPIVVKREPNETWVESVNKSDMCVEMTQVNKNVLCIKKIRSIKKEKSERNLSEVKDKDDKAKFKQFMGSVLAEGKTQYSKAKCDYCNKELLKKSLLSHIRERHLKLRKFHCDTCNKRFARHYQLVDHRCGQQNGRRGRKVKVLNL